MLRVGLTGGMGSGKALVARLLERKGAFVIDADQLAREAVRPGRKAWREIVREFGSSMIAAGGEIDRGALARIVFSSPDKLRRLNAIVHPPVIGELRRRLDAVGREGKHDIAVADAALLFEAGIEGDFDRIVVVTCPREERIRRCRTRDGLSQEEIEHRLDAQMDLEEKARRADYVIDNGGTRAAAEKQVESLWKDLIRNAG